MNFNLYIFGRSPGYNQYPEDDTRKLYLKFYRRQQVEKQFVVYRNGQLIYYTYIHKLSGNKFFGIGLVFNGVCCNRIHVLIEMFRGACAELLRREQLFENDKKGRPCLKQIKFIDTVSEFKRIRTFFSEGIDRNLKKDFLPLPAAEGANATRDLEFPVPEERIREEVAAFRCVCLALVDRVAPDPASGPAESSVSSRMGDFTEEAAPAAGRPAAELDAGKFAEADLPPAKPRAGFDATGETNRRSSRRSRKNDPKPDDAREEPSRNKAAEIYQPGKGYVKIIIVFLALIVFLGGVALVAIKHPLPEPSLSSEERDAIAWADTIPKRPSPGKVDGSKDRVIVAVPKRDTAGSGAPVPKNGNRLPKGTAAGRSNSFEITAIALANVKKDGTIVTGYGSPLKSENLLYLGPRLEYEGAKVGMKDVTVKFFRSREITDGGGFVFDTLQRTEKVYFFDQRGTCVLTKWGQDSAGTWKSGDYRIEIWCDGNCKNYKKFTIY